MLKVTKQGLVLKLIKFYRDHENHHPDVSVDDLIDFFQKLIDQDRIIIEWAGDEIVGYVQYFRLNYAEFGFIVLNPDLFDVYKYNIKDGNICYLANILIHPSYRKTLVIKRLKRKFFEKNGDAEYIVGHKNGKRFKPIAVFQNRRKI